MLKGDIDTLQALSGSENCHNASVSSTVGLQDQIEQRNPPSVIFKQLSICCGLILFVSVHRLCAGLSSICCFSFLFVFSCAKIDVTAVSCGIQGVLFLQLKCSPKRKY